MLSRTIIYRLKKKKKKTRLCKLLFIANLIMKCQCKISSSDKNTWPNARYAVRWALRRQTWSKYTKLNTVVLGSVEQLGRSFFSSFYYASLNGDSRCLRSMPGAQPWASHPPRDINRCWQHWLTQLRTTVSLSILNGFSQRASTYRINKDPYTDILFSQIRRKMTPLCSVEVHCSPKTDFEMVRTQRPPPPPPQKKIKIKTKQLHAMEVKVSCCDSLWDVRVYRAWLSYTDLHTEYTASVEKG